MTGTSGAITEFHGMTWTPAAMPTTMAPTLMVVVDAEADFDWSQPFSRHETSVRSMAAQPRMHRIFERYGLRPTYAVDHAVASQADGIAPLRELLSDDLCLIGAHLQPWLNPPFVEDVSERNSFPGNLSPALEHEKLAVLTRTIQDNFALEPRLYKAGRYGLGTNTFQTLAALGYTVDLSAVPGADMRFKHGPDFRTLTAQPYWVGDEAPILAVPLTRAYIGMLARYGPSLETLLVKSWAEGLHLPGILARLNLLDRIILTPEGVPHHQHAALARALVARGCRIFCLTYHSPSLVPGNTPYVRSDADLQAFFDRVEQFCDLFFGDLGGVAGDPLSLRDRLSERRSDPAPALCHASTG